MSLLPHLGHVLELEVLRKKECLRPKPIGPCLSGTWVGEEHYHRRCMVSRPLRLGPLMYVGPCCGGTRWLKRTGARCVGSVRLSGYCR